MLILSLASLLLVNKVDCREYFLRMGPRWFQAASRHFPVLREANELREDREAANRPTNFARDLLDSMGVRRLMPPSAEDSIPPQGTPTIIIANHGSGFMEAAILLELALRKRSDVKLLGIERGGINGLDEHLLKIADPELRSTRGTLKEMVRHVRSGGALIIFPSGNIASVPDETGTMKEPPFKSSFVSLAKQTNAVVVPFFIELKNSPFYYKYRNFYLKRRHALLGTLYNFFLVREFLKFSDSTIEIKMDPPIHPNSWGSQDDSAIAKNIQEQIYRMRLPSEPEKN